MTTSILIIFLAVTLVFLSRKSQINDILLGAIDSLRDEKLLLFERYSKDIIYDEETFKIEFVRYYTEPFEADYELGVEENFDLSALLKKHFFNTSSWNEKEFRSEADSRGIYNVVITKYD